MFELYEPLLVGGRHLWHLLMLKWWLLTLVLGLVLVGLSLWQSQAVFSPTQSKPVDAAALTIIEPDDQIVVDVAGAVLHPGMYQLDREARIGQAIARAGGFQTGVDDRLVAQTINLAKKLQDEDKIYVPFISDNEIILPQQQPTSNKVSINTASQKQLEALSGIGEKRASEIISGRPYKSLSELVERNILSKTIFSQLQTAISL